MKIEPNDSVAVRAVKGVLAGYVVGKVTLQPSDATELHTGGVYAVVKVYVEPTAIAKMLEDEEYGRIRRRDNCPKPEGMR